MANDLSGNGSARHPGRWNSQGRPPLQLQFDRPGLPGNGGASGWRRSPAVPAPAGADHHSQPPLAAARDFSQRGAQRLGPSPHSRDRRSLASFHPGLGRCLAARPRIADRRGAFGDRAGGNQPAAQSSPPSPPAAGGRDHAPLALRRPSAARGTGRHPPGGAGLAAAPRGWSGPGDGADPGRASNEGPQHRVRLAPFSIGGMPITQAQPPPPVTTPPPRSAPAAVRVRARSGHRG